MEPARKQLKNVVARKTIAAEYVGTLPQVKQLPRSAPLMALLPLSLRVPQLAAWFRSRTLRCMGRLFGLAGRHVLYDRPNY